MLRIARFAKNEKSHDIHMYICIFCLKESKNNE